MPAVVLFGLMRFDSWLAMWLVIFAFVLFSNFLLLIVLLMLYLAGTCLSSIDPLVCFYCSYAFK